MEDRGVTRTGKGGPSAASPSVGALPGWVGAVIAILGVVAWTNPGVARGPTDPEAPGGVQAAAAQAGNFTGQVKPVLYVADVEESMPFYRDVLGFEFLGYSNAGGEPYYAEMAAGPLKFGLHDPMNPEQETWIGHQRLYFRVLDLDAQRSRVLEGHGVPGEVVRTDWMDMFIVRDPYGHEIVFAETDPSRHSVDPW